METYVRHFIIIIMAISFLITNVIAEEKDLSHTEQTNIEEIYQKKESKSWGDVFYNLFNRKDFGKSYALVVGIGDYQQEWLKLEAPFRDACRVRDFLIHEAGFDYVVTLTNAKATSYKIDKWMVEDFPKLIDEDDRFLFYFSGHGTQQIRKDIPFGYLVLQNCGIKSYGSMIAMKDIEYWDSLLYPTRHVLFILDCCFSGLAGKQHKSSMIDKKLERLTKYAHHLITAGTKDEKSVASLSRWHGSLFTDSFLKATEGRADLSGDDFEADGIVSLKELMKYIGERIDKESYESEKKNPLRGGIKMSPQISDLQENEGEFFFITKDFTNIRTGNIKDFPQIIAIKDSIIKSREYELEKSYKEIYKLNQKIENLNKPWKYWFSILIAVLIIVSIRYTYIFKRSKQISMEQSCKYSDFKTNLLLATRKQGLKVEFPETYFYFDLIFYVNCKDLVRYFLLILEIINPENGFEIREYIDKNEATFIFSLKKAIEINDIRNRYVKFRDEISKYNNYQNIKSHVDIKKGIIKLKIKI